MKDSIKRSQRINQGGCNKKKGRNQLSGLFLFCGRLGRPMFRLFLTAHKSYPIRSPISSLAASGRFRTFRKLWDTQRLLNGADETRTRDLRRDRPFLDSCFHWFQQLRCDRKRQNATKNCNFCNQTGTKHGAQKGFRYHLSMMNLCDLQLSVLRVLNAHTVEYLVVGWMRYAVFRHGARFCGRRPLH